MRSNSDAEMLDTAGPAAVAAASTGSKKATLQKLMSFDMMEPGYPMDEEMMLEVWQYRLWSFKSEDTKLARF